MGSLFSSPSKTAQAAAGATGAEAQQMIQQAENYVTSQQQQERAAIAGLPSNPYFDAAHGMSPSAYQVNPSDTQSFGQSNLPPGLSSGGNSTPQAPPPQNPFAPPPSSQRQTQPVARSTNVGPPTAPVQPPQITPPAQQRPVPPSDNPFAPRTGNPRMMM